MSKVANARAPVTTPGDPLGERTRIDVYGPLPVALDDVREQAGDQWVIWFGFSTRRWWGLPRHQLPGWDGLCEGATPAALLVAVREVDEYFGLASHRTPSGSWKAA